MLATSRFPDTAWSEVSRARGALGPSSRAALEALCAAYWPPLFAYARRRGHAVEDALDLTQGFFTALLEKSYLEDVRLREGRFRAFLLGSFSNFLAKERQKDRALKRGGGATLLSIDGFGAEAGRVEPASSLTPEAAFERRWALTTLERALARLREEAVANGRGREYEHLHRYLTGHEPSPSYRDVAAELGATEGSIKVAVHRLRQRFGKLLRQEVAATVVEPSQVDDELRHLLSVVQPLEPLGGP